MLFARIKGTPMQQDNAIEVERKFLVLNLPSDLREIPSNKIRQGYLAVTEDEIEVRVRKQGKQCFLTVKGGAGQDRTEVEIPLDRTTFDSPWPLTRGRRVRKVRYRLSQGERAVAVDVYRGKLKGLVTAEVEFSGDREADEFRPPDWLGREVTGDLRFSN
jgi:CYTH domain-containing protein